MSMSEWRLGFGCSISLFVVKCTLYCIATAYIHIQCINLFVTVAHIM